MMASWKPKHVVKYYLKLQTYFINCCVVTVSNKEISKCLYGDKRTNKCIINNFYVND
jgi:hypothetical protein